ncbi:hypothetical protein M2454_000554 [Aequitasia blattaphilus]|uniref:Uncharacterized protein n=1 Tax=Aequitasia blattaphilus TaxID=2949332 RepID=A0ABT1EBB9_9FIRM|nr:hypothetical protein [Aequitasia blattaphilus]MCP1102227.1 hypothetical protein [Aequitasia blattaphilus]MCR8614867.1 hypothetical protein [Aequitasia blattaphilus]
MKFKKRLLSFAAIFLLFSAMYLNSVADETKSNKELDSWGEYLATQNTNPKFRSRSTKKKSYAKGNHIIVTSEDIAQAKIFFSIAGMTDEIATEAAYEHVTQRESLYYQALQNGYLCSDGEVLEKIQELKDILIGENASTESKQQAEEIIKHFDNEEAYWDYQKKVYEKNLPIEKYVSSLMDLYYQENPNASSDDWNEYFETFKRELVREENVQIN